MSTVCHMLTMQGGHPDDDLVAQAAMYRLIIENTIDLIIRYNNAGARIYVSPSSFEMFGFAPSELIGQEAAMLIHPDDFARVHPHFQKVGPACPSLHLTFRVCRKDGIYIWVEGQYRYVPEDGGSVAVLRDVTARKEAEALQAEASEKLATANRLLQALAQQDGLTGLANRRYFDQLLDEALARARRHEQPLSVLMIDVDCFKAYNDRYGHLRGDECLRLIGSVIAETIGRPDDRVARYGGEEFVALLQETDRLGAETVAERMRGAVAALGLEHLGSGFGVATVSIGISSIIPIHDDNAEARLLYAADCALYQAKAEGRNRICYGSVAVSAEVY